MGSSTGAQVRPHRHSVQAAPRVATLHLTPVTHTHCWGSPSHLKHDTAQSTGLPVMLQGRKNPKMRFVTGLTAPSVTRQINQRIVKIGIINRNH